MSYSINPFFVLNKLPQGCPKGRKIVTVSTYATKNHPFRGSILPKP